MATFVAGAYTATWTGVTIGGTRDGFRVRVAQKQQMVQMDTFGEGAVDAVQVGAELEVTLDFVQYGSVKLAMNAQLALADGSGSAGNVKATVGKILVDSAIISGVLALTAATGTSAASDDGATKWIFDNAVVISDIDLLLGSHLREGPLTFRCFPNLGLTNTGKALRIASS